MDNILNIEAIIRGTTYERARDKNKVYLTIDCSTIEYMLYETLRRHLSVDYDTNLIVECMTNTENELSTIIITDNKHTEASKSLNSEQLSIIEEIEAVGYPMATKKLLGILFGLPIDKIKTETYGYDYYVITLPIDILSVTKEGVVNLR